MAGDPFNQRNKVLNIAAASDAAHDFHEVRGNPGIVERFKSALKALMKGTRLERTGDINFEVMQETIQEIGTVSVPTKYYKHGSEWKVFKELIGLERNDLVGHEGEAPRLLRVPVGDTIREVSLQCLKLGERDEGTTRWTMGSVDIFEAITGDADETSLYFMIDAVNVRFYDALAADTGAQRKVAFYLHARESDNDAAGKPNLARLVKDTKVGHAVRFEEIRDEYDYLITYPPLSTGPAKTEELFNSIYTVSIESSVKTKTKEGLRTVITKFQNPDFQSDPIVVQKGVAEEQHPNAVNSIFPALARVYKALVGSRGATAEKHKYWSLLQQKRSGDWLQALACLDTNRFLGKAVPKGMPIFLATEDIICAAYAIFIGVNVIFTYHYNEPGRPMQYCIAVFRAPAAVASPDARLKTQIATANLAVNPVVGTLRYNQCMSIYQEERARLTELLLKEVTAACAAVTPQRSEAGRPMRSTDRVFANRSAVDSAVHRVLEQYVKVLQFLHLMPEVKGQDDDAWDDDDITKLARVAASDRNLTPEEYAVAQRLYDQTMTNCAILKALNANGATEASFRASLQEIATKKPVAPANLHRFSFTQSFEDIPPRVLALFQSLDSECPPTLLAPLKQVFARLSATLGGYAGADRNQYVLRVEATVKSIQYVIFKDTATIPLVERPTDAALITRLTESDLQVKLTKRGREDEPTAHAADRAQREADDATPPVEPTDAPTAEQLEGRAATTLARLTAPATRGRVALEQIGEVMRISDSGAFIPVQRILVHFKQSGIYSQVSEQAIQSLFVRAALGMSGGGSRSRRRSGSRSRSKTQSKRRARSLAAASHPLVTVWFLIRHLLSRLSYGPAPTEAALLQFVVRWFLAVRGVQEELQIPAARMPLLYFSHFGILEAILLQALPTLSSRPSLAGLVRRFMEVDLGELQDVATGFCDTVFGFQSAPRLESVLKDTRLLPVALRVIERVGRLEGSELSKKAFELYLSIPQLLDVIQIRDASMTPSKLRTRSKTRMTQRTAKTRGTRRATGTRRQRTRTPQALPA